MGQFTSRTQEDTRGLRRRRSSTNTQSSLPPSRRRRVPAPLRFWSRGESEDIAEPLETNSNNSQRFIDELDDIASHLSQTLQRLPNRTNHNASINSDLSSPGPISFQHQTEMLSRLLEVAATSTVVTLMGSSVVNGRRFDNTSRSDDTADNQDSTFQEFVTSLRNGLLTNELSRNYDDNNSENMTFFRAFRFDSSTPTTANSAENIPVMIVGVRSVQQGSETFENPLQDNVDWFVRGNDTNEQPDDTASDAVEERGDFQEPLPQQPTANQRSWVIFVMGNSFAWNHPLLSAPSLMNETPTYEDLLNLQELIGQVKPQVTTQDELNKHEDQLFELILTDEEGKSNHEKLELSSLHDQCQICITNYEDHDIVRKLTSCNHFYHQECIDTWLLKGKNNCPLCRSKGISGESETHL